MPQPDSQRASLRSLHPGRWDIPVLVILAITLLIVGQSTPTMLVEQLWGIKKQTYTIWTGVVMLAQNGVFFLAAIVFLFSVIFPYAKLTAILVLWFKKFGPEDRSTMARWLGVLGKWSMLDVFVVAVFVVLTEASSLISVKPRYGIYIFAGAIVVSIVVSLLIERIAEREKENYLIEKGKAQAGA